MEYATFETCGAHYVLGADVEPNRSIFSYTLADAEIIVPCLSAADAEITAITMALKAAGYDTSDN